MISNLINPILKMNQNNDDKEVFDINDDQYIETPWSIIEAYFKGQHLERLVRHQLESYNNFVGHQISKTIEMFNPVRIASEQDFNPTFKKYDVTHYCVPNIPSRVSRTASHAFSNILMPILLRCGEVSGIKNLIYENGGIRNGIYLYKGNLTNEHLANMFSMKNSNLDLLFATNL